MSEMRTLRGVIGRKTLAYPLKRDNFYAIMISEMQKSTLTKEVGQWEPGMIT